VKEGREILVTIDTVVHIIIILIPIIFIFFKTYKNYHLELILQLFFVVFNFFNYINTERSCTDRHHFPYCTVIRIPTSDRFHPVVRVAVHPQRTVWFVAVRIAHTPRHDRFPARSLGARPTEPRPAGTGGRTARARRICCWSSSRVPPRPPGSPVSQIRVRRRPAGPIPRLNPPPEGKGLSSPGHASEASNSSIGSLVVPCARAGGADPSRPGRGVDSSPPPPPPPAAAGKGPLAWLSSMRGTRLCITSS